MKKISLVLAVLLLFSSISSAVFASRMPFDYDDVQEDEWYYDYVKWAYDKGIAGGTGPNTWSPDAEMTRAMYVTLLVGVAYNLGENVFDSREYPLVFTDVDGTEYYNIYLRWAVEKGLIKGTSDTTFSPDDSITREQMAVLLINFGEYMGFILPAPDEDIEVDYDFEDASEWAITALYKLLRAGLISGYDDGTIKPARVTTRAEAVKLLYTYLQACDVELGEATDERWPD